LSNDVGDLGGESAPDQPLSHRRLEERAVFERWNIGEENRTRILKRVCRFLDDETEEGSRAKPRTILAAARVILAADRINLEQRRIELASGDGSLNVRDVLTEAEESADAYQPARPPSANESGPAASAPGSMP
jgi:hypothetical protein